MERLTATMAPTLPSHILLERRALYWGLDHPEDPRLLLENAAKMADACGRDPVIDYLYSHARAPHAPRDVWIRQALVASCMGFLLEDFFMRKTPSSVRHMFDPAAVATAVQAMTSPRGVLVMTFHGSFAGLLPHFFHEFIDDSLMIAFMTTPIFRSVGADKPSAALFAGLCALREGRSVYVAPDGRLGRPTGHIELLGARCPVSDGAAFLAYETGCDTVWYAIRRNGRLLAPVAEPGPTRALGETYAEFRTRLMEFYRSKIEEQLTGDPDNLAVSLLWRILLTDAMREQAGLGAEETPRRDHPPIRAHGANLERPDDPDRLLENAETMADASGPDPVLDYLYDRARAPQLSREAWTRQAVVASSIQSLLKDVFAPSSPRRLRDLFDAEAAGEAARALSSDRGVLALTFNGGFTALLRHFFAGFIEDSVVIDTKTRPKFRSLGANNPGAALFGALRALEQGRSVSIAPDGYYGRPAGCIQVLGASCPVSGGASFLAYQTGCDTAWYALRREGRLFVPVVERGPRRAAGETFSGFRLRLMRFYRDRIEDHLTGDPSSIAVSKVWRGLLLKAMEDGRIAASLAARAERA